MTSQERRTEYKNTWYANSRKAKAERANAQEGRTNAGEISAHAGVEEMSESSTMGASGGTIGDSILPDSGNPFSIPEGALEIEQSDDPSVTPEEEYILRTNLNLRRVERVSDSDETMIDATNEEDSLTNAVPDVTFGPQEDNTDASTSTPWGSPTLSELIESAHADHDREEATPDMPSYPYNYITGPDAMWLYDFDQSYPVGPFNQTGNLLTLAPLDQVPPQFPMHPPSSPQIPIDPVLLHMDAVNFNNGRDPTIRNPQDAYVRPESPHDSKKQTESKKGN